LFKNILIPISSEFYLKDVLEKGADLAEKFESKVTILYIIEEKTLIQTDKSIDTYRTSFEKEETKKIIINNHIKTAEIIVFNDAKFYFSSKNISPSKKITKGEFSSSIENEVNTQHFDLVIIGYEKECLLKYHILDEIKIPLWIVGKSGDNNLLAVCSNLTPNRKIPIIGQDLAKIFNLNFYLIYIVDINNKTLYDENKKNFSDKTIEHLFDDAKKFVDDMQKKGINAQIALGSFEKNFIKATKQLSPNLVVIGQEQKRYDILGFPVKSINHKIVEKTKNSILFLN